MKSQDAAKDVTALLRARNPLIWVVTREEGRAELCLMQAAAAAGYLPRTWDVAQGVTEMDGKPTRIGGPDPGETLNAIRDRATNANGTGERCAWILRDLPPWLEGTPGASVRRQLRNLARLLPTIAKDRSQAVIILTPSKDVPAELANHTTVIDWPMPDREEIAAILDGAIENLPAELRTTAAPNGTRDAAIDAAIGLSGEEAASCYARSLVKLRKIDPAIVSTEKKRVIARERVLEWFDPLPGGLDAVGGLELLKAWLVARKGAYTPAARAYGLPAPKGVLIGGIQGCGKSLTAKAVATAYEAPLLRVDMGALKSKFVGESEGNLRRMFQVIGAVGRCVVWLDEIEKAVAGATQGAADGGVSADALGAFLQWMQERQGEAFVVATANDVDALPPELIRKGRFDELFWVDLPTASERVAILRASLAAHGRSKITVDLPALAAASDSFTGSEVASLVPDAMYAAYADGAREITTQDLITVAGRLTPLSKTAAEKITRLRQWGKTRMRPASAEEGATAAATTGRQIDLG